MSLSTRCAALTGGLAALLVALAAVPAGAAVATLPGAPITVHVGDRGQLQAHREGDSTNVFYAPSNQTGDAGFFLAFPDLALPLVQPDALKLKVFGFSGSAGPFLDQVYVPRSQSAPSGAGTEADPFRQVTTYAVNPTGVDPVDDAAVVTQTTTYVAGRQSFGVRWEVKNLTATALHFKAIAAADFFFEGSDVGTGIFTQGPPRFVGGTNADTGRSGGFLEAGASSLSPPWSHYQALRFASADGNEVWQKVQEAAAHGPVNSFDDTVVGESVDNAGAVEWDQYLEPTRTLGTNQVATFELNVRTSAPAALQFDQTNAGAPQGVPITITATAKDTSDVPFAGRNLRYTITGANPISGAVVVDAAGNAAITDPGTNAGADTIVAYIDLNNNNAREANEPQGSALATFVDQTPPSCKVAVTGDRTVSSGGQGKPLVITVNCDSPATVVSASTLTITPAATAKKAKKAGASAAATKNKPKPVVVKLKPATSVVAPGQALPVSIAIPSSVTKKYPGATARATVTLTATDQAGNVATATTAKTLKIAKAKVVKKKAAKG